ncbi:MAG: hypothetical protein ACRYFR_08750 [Janthinobacterium lividum]
MGRFLAALLAAGLAGYSVDHLPWLDARYYPLVQTKDSTRRRQVATVPRHRFYVG